MPNILKVILLTISGAFIYPVAAVSDFVYNHARGPFRLRLLHVVVNKLTIKMIRAMRQAIIMIDAEDPAVYLKKAIAKLYMAEFNLRR